MNLRSSDGPKAKRIKAKDDSEEESCSQMTEDDIPEISAEDVSDSKSISRRKDWEELEGLVESDNEGSGIDSDNEQFTFPPDEDISDDMLEEIQYSDHFPSVTNRYFTPYYKIDVKSPGDDICIWVHSNRICMLCLAPSHVILQDNKRIKKVDFKVSEKLDRSLNKVSGKGKHGAQPLQTNSNICTISCSDEERYVIKCCMIGKLVEINAALSKNPQLIKKPPHKGGYLAIILPNIKRLESLKQTLLTRDQYVERINEREGVEDKKVKDGMEDTEDENMEDEDTEDEDTEDKEDKKDKEYKEDVKNTEDTE